MKGKYFLRMSVLSGAVVLAALLSSCNKDEQGSAPTVSVEAVSSDASSITLRISFCQWTAECRYAGGGTWRGC